jgi:hypothetical protein
LIYVGLLIVVLVMVWLAVKAYRVYSTYRATAPHLANLQSLVSAGRANPTELDVAQIEDSLRGTAAGLETLSDDLRPFLPLTRYMGWVPTYGGDIQAAPCCALSPGGCAGPEPGRDDPPRTFLSVA